MANHARLSASAAHRWMACPGSIALIATCPPQETSVYALEGTKAHELASKSLESGKLCSKFPGYAEEAYDAVQTYLAVVREDKKALETEYKNKAQKVVLSVEVQLDELQDLHRDLGGTADACLTVPFGKLVVYDFKFGAGVQVEPEENEQLMTYGLGALLALGDFDPVEFVIVQPRGGGSPVKRWVTSQKHVYEFGDRLVAAAKETEKKNAKLCAGDHCKFCPALSKCPKVQEEVMKTTALDFAQPAPQVLPDPTALTLPQVKKILDLLPLVDDWARAVEEHAESLAKSGQNIPGYKLVKKRSNRAWISEPEVLKSFEPLYGAKIFAPRKLLTPAQMEKLTGKGNAIIVDTLCMNPDNGECLVPEKDPRPGVGSSVALDFQPKQ